MCVCVCVCVCVCMWVFVHVYTVYCAVRCQGYFPPRVPYWLVHCGVVVPSKQYYIVFMNTKTVSKTTTVSRSQPLFKIWTHSPSLWWCLSAVRERCCLWVVSWVSMWFLCWLTTDQVMHLKHTKNCVTNLC